MAELFLDTGRRRMGAASAWLGSLALSKATKGKGKKSHRESYASSSAAAAAATADGFGHARASKFECGSGTLA